MLTPGAVIDGRYRPMLKRCAIARSMLPFARPFDENVTTWLCFVIAATHTTQGETHCDDSVFKPSPATSPGLPEFPAANTGTMPASHAAFCATEIASLGS